MANQENLWVLKEMGLQEDYFKQEQVGDQSFETEDLDVVIILGSAAQTKVVYEKIIAKVAESEQ